MFELTEQITIDGKAYRIRSDFRVVLEIFVMLQDPELDDGDRTEALMRMFYVDRPEDVKAAIEMAESLGVKVIKISSFVEDSAANARKTVLKGYPLESRLFTEDY